MLNTMRLTQMMLAEETPDEHSNNAELLGFGPVHLARDPGLGSHMNAR